MISEDKKLAFDNAFESGQVAERDFIISRIKAQICFDALADADGRCKNHSGKCYELGQLISELMLRYKVEAKCICDDCEIEASKGYDYCFDCLGECDAEGYPECTCDPCDDKECNCRSHKCDFCKEKEN